MLLAVGGAALVMGGATGCGGDDATASAAGGTGGSGGASAGSGGSAGSGATDAGGKDAGGSGGTGGSGATDSGSASDASMTQDEGVESGLVDASEAGDATTSATVIRLQNDLCLPRHLTTAADGTVNCRTFSLA